MARTKTRKKRALPAVRTRSTQLAANSKAKKRAHPLAKANERLSMQLQTARAKVRAVKQEFQSQGMTQTALNGSFVCAGGGALGALKGITGRDYIAGIAIEVPAAILSAAAGAYLKQPALIYASAGILAVLAEAVTQELTEDLQAGAGLGIPPAGSPVDSSPAPSVPRRKELPSRSRV